MESRRNTTAVGKSFGGLEVENYILDATKGTAALNFHIPLLVSSLFLVAIALIPLIFLGRFSREISRDKTVSYWRRMVGGFKLLAAVERFAAGD